MMKAGTLSRKVDRKNITKMAIGWRRLAREHFNGLGKRAEGESSGGVREKVAGEGGR